MNNATTHLCPEPRFTPENQLVLLDSATLSTPPDVMARLLLGKRSLNTRRAYARDLQDFFNYVAQKPPTPHLVAQFLKLEQAQAINIVSQYKESLMAKGLSESTVNRRLAAIKSLVQLGRVLGMCDFLLEDVKAERIQSYRDTAGVTPEAIFSMIKLIDTSTSIGKRDYAIMRLMWDNALRRNEICQLNIGDFNPTSSCLSILGKGRGTQKETIKLSRKTTVAITDWLITSKRTNVKTDEALFVALVEHFHGKRLSGEFIRKLVDTLAQQAGIPKKMSPHRIRHSAITKATEVFDGDYQKVQKFSRHANINTVVKYDDNRKKQEFQAIITDTLADLF
jgi:integrase/recombinase XerC